MKISTKVHLAIISTVAIILTWTVLAFIAIGSDMMYNDTSFQTAVSNVTGRAVSKLPLFTWIFCIYILVMGSILSFSKILKRKK